MSLAGRVAIVTGGTRGIGRAIVDVLATAGASVVLTGRDPARVRETARELEARGVQALGVVAEMGRGEDIQRVVTTAQERFSRIDVLVNNAGITRDGLLIRMKDSDWDEVLGVNLRAAFQALRATARVMARQRSGRVINITSTAGAMGTAGQANYSAARRG